MYFVVRVPLGCTPFFTARIICDSYLFVIAVLNLTFESLLFLRRNGADSKVRMGDEGPEKRPENGDPTVYTVEKILKKRKRQGFIEYLVKWKNYTSK